MIDEPLSLRSGASLPRLKELEVELSKGAHWLRDERHHRAGDLARTYQIRLGIARDKGINGGIPDEENETADNLKFLVGNLNVEPERVVTGFLLRGSETLQYWIFEGEMDGVYLGAIVGNRSGK